MSGLRRLVFIGGRELGARCLAALLASEALVVGVLARSDETGGPQSVRSLADAHGAPWLAPPRLGDPDVAEWVRSLKPDLGICVMFPHRIPAAVLGAFPSGIANLHGAPLPAYRGCLGHAWAIINGDESYGVTLHWMGIDLDTGPVIREATFPIAADETGASLHAKAVEAAYVLFADTLPVLLAGPGAGTPQDESAARYYSRRPPFDRLVDWRWPAEFVVRYVRAMVFPGVPMPQATICGREVEVLSVGLVTAVDAVPSAGPPGAIAEANERGVTVRTGDGAVVVEAVQALAPDAVPVTGRAVGPFLGWTGVGVR